MELLRLAWPARLVRWFWQRCLAKRRLPPSRTSCSSLPTIWASAMCRCSTPARKCRRRISIACRTGHGVHRRPLAVGGLHAHALRRPDRSLLLALATEARVLNGYSAPLLEPGRLTVAGILRASGYHTSIVGKWHLGLGFQKGADGKIDYAKPVTDGPNEPRLRLLAHYPCVARLPAIRLHREWQNHRVAYDRPAGGEVPRLPAARPAPARTGDG